MVAGPTPINMIFFNGAGKPVRGTVPRVLEYGGAVGILEVWRALSVRGKTHRRMRRKDRGMDLRGEWVRADLRSRRRLAGKKTRIRIAHVRARPYMGPALRTALPRIKEFWRGGLQVA